MNILEKKAILLALNAFPDSIIGKAIVLMSYSATVVTFLKKQGRTVYLTMYKLAQEIITWPKLIMISSSARYVTGKRNIFANQLSQPDQVLPTKWSIHPWRFVSLPGVRLSFSVDLFITRSNVKLPITCVSHSRSYGLEEVCFPARMGQSGYLLLSFVHSQLASSIKSNVNISLHDHGGSIVATEGVVFRYFNFWWENVWSSPWQESLVHPHLTPKRRECISHTCLWAGGFQRYRKSFKIGQKPFYSPVNDKEW